MSRLVAARWLRAFVAFVAAQAALLYGYALWGAVKELGRWCSSRCSRRSRAVIREPARSPRALAAARGRVRRDPLRAEPAGAVWLVRADARRQRSSSCAASRSRLGARRVRGARAVLSIPALVAAFYGPAKVAPREELQAREPRRPAERMQMFGIWLTGDFRAARTTHV